MKMFSRSLAVIVSFLAITLFNLSHADTLADIKEKGEISVGYIPYDELTYRDTDTGDIVGFFPSLLEKIVGEMGISPDKITYVATDWSNFTTGLQTGRYDVSIAGTFSTIPRASNAAFTDPIFYLGNSAMVLEGDKRFDNIEDVMDLDREEFTVAVVSGEQSHEFVKKAFKNAKIEVVRSSDLTSALLQVMSRRADVALSDHFVVRKFVAAQEGAKDLFAGRPWNMQPISWAVRHEDQALLTFLNTALGYLASTGQLQEMMRDPAYKDVPFSRQSSELVQVD